MRMKVSDFDYELPPELIAQHPPNERKQARMLVMDRSNGNVRIKSFTDFPEHVSAEDCVVFNDTRVIPARLFGHRAETGGQAEILLLEELSPGTWQCMLRPGRRLRPGSRIRLNADPEVVLSVESKHEDGTYTVSFSVENVLALAEDYGHMPLPPYVRRSDTSRDRDRYQTVYANSPGGIAAPTAGLHFTEDILEQLRAKGVSMATITLHPGPGTFRPVETEDVEQHDMHEEPYELSAETAETINTTRQEGGRIIAVGTTTVRVLESCVDTEHHQIRPGRGRTDLFLHPPYKPSVTDVLLTNFHLPRSTLLMLVCTFSSRDKVLNAYHQAIREKMRFYSYGDCMLLV